VPIAFEQFVQAYPANRRTGRNAALDLWLSLSLDEGQEQEIIASVTAWAQSDEWRRDGGRFVPAIDRFLRDRLYESPPTPPEPEEWAHGVKKCPKCSNFHHLTREECLPPPVEMTEEQVQESRRLLREKLREKGIGL